jgi:hypothetical protein
MACLTDGLHGFLQHVELGHTVLIEERIANNEE